MGIFSRYVSRLGKITVVWGVWVAIAFPSLPALRAQTEPSPKKDSTPAIVTPPPVLAPEPEVPKATPTTSPLPANVQSYANSGVVFPIFQIEGYVAGVDSVTFTADSQAVISGGSRNDPHIKVWSVATGEELKNFRAQSSGIFALNLSPDGTTLVSSGESSDLYFWELPLSQEKFIALDHFSKVLALAITPDSRFLVTGGLDGIKVWTMQPRRLLYNLTEFGDPGYALAMHPNGFLVASGDDRGRVKIWNLQNGEMVSEFLPHQREISKLLFTQDGKTLITASFDRTIKLWDVATGQLLLTLVGHTGAIRGLALSPDGQFLASASNDGIRIWKMADGRQYQHLTRHQDWVTSVAFSPDGHYLASGGIDRKVIIWSFPEQFALDRPSRVDSIFEQTAPDSDSPIVPVPPSLPETPLPVAPNPQTPSPSNPFPVNSPR